MSCKNTMSPSVANIDALPESAQIDLNALRLLTGKTRSTVYRWVNAGLLPAPRKIGANSHNVWSVGDIRRFLNGEAAR